MFVLSSFFDDLQRLFESDYVPNDQVRDAPEKHGQHLSFISGYSALSRTVDWDDRNQVPFKREVPPHDRCWRTKIWTTEVDQCLRRHWCNTLLGQPQWLWSVHVRGSSCGTCSVQVFFCNRVELAMLLSSRIKCRMPWKFGIRYVTTRFSLRHLSSVTHYFLSFRCWWTFPFADSVLQQKGSVWSENPTFRYSRCIPSELSSVSIRN